MIRQAPPRSTTLINVFDELTDTTHELYKRLDRLRNARDLALLEAAIALDEELAAATGRTVCGFFTREVEQTFSPKGPHLDSYDYVGPGKRQCNQPVGHRDGHSVHGPGQWRSHDREWLDLMRSGYDAPDENLDERKLVNASGQPMNDEQAAAAQARIVAASERWRAERHERERRQRGAGQ